MPCSRCYTCAPAVGRLARVLGWLRPKTIVPVALSIIAGPSPVAGQIPSSSVARPPVPGAPSGVTAFVDVTVVPMDTERALPGHTVLVQHGRITALGPTSKVQVPTGAVRIDGGGQFLLPGFGDCHAHLTANHNADSAQIEHRLLSYLRYGVTTIRNMDAHPVAKVLPGASDPAERLVLRLRVRAAAGTLLSPRIYTAGSWAGRMTVDHPVAPESVATYVAAYQAAGYDFLKPYYEGAAVFDSLLSVARRARLPVAGHIPQGTVEQALTSGVYQSIDHLHRYFELGRHDELLDSARVADLAAATRRAGVWNCPTLTVNDGRGSRQLVKALQDAGAGLLLGTDGLLSPEHADPVRELRNLVAAGLTPYQALRTGTQNMAAFFGTLEESGTVAVGKRADLVVLASNPLVDVGHAAEPVGVMLGGRWLPRAELERRLQQPVPERVRSRERSRDWRFVEQTLANLLNEIRPPEAQRRRLRQRLQTYEAERNAFSDSLDAAGVLGKARQSRVAERFAQQLGEFRALLTPAQQAVFDPRARAWMQYRQVTIPGVMP
jgi:imidazolonepropionase-like amidohydrolase